LQLTKPAPGEVLGAVFAAEPCVRRTDKSMSEGVAEVWFRERIQEAETASSSGKREEAVDLLSDLADHCRREGRLSLSQWHEIQALWILGVTLEELNRHQEAAAAYGRILKLRRAALAESSSGLASAALAAALSELRAGNARRGLRIGAEALRLHHTYPMSEVDKAALERAMEKAAGALRRKAKARETRRRRTTGCS
jgi:tetratricopeptide (TPR) repeat protein